MAASDISRACAYLERYTDLAVTADWPLKLHGDAYFDQLDDWLENRVILGENMPRDEKLVRKSIVEAVVENPAFAALQEESVFREIVKRLEKFERQAGDGEV